MPNPKRAIRVLHLESDGTDLAFVRRALAHGRESFTVAQATSPGEAKRQLAGEYDVLLLEPALYGDGFDVLEFVRSHPTVPTVLLTDEDASRLMSRAMQAGAHDVLEKGEVSGAELRHCLAAAVERHRGLDRLSLAPAPGTIAQSVEDLRNLLTVALASLQMIRRQVDQDASLTALCEHAESSIRRAADVTAALERDGSEGGAPRRSS